MSGGKKGCKYEEEEELRRGPWTHEEDTLLVRYIARQGEGRWNLLARCSGLKRTGKSCRLRWLNYLKPDVKRGNLTPEEQIVILELHSMWGNKWSRIAQHLPGRTDNEIKNYWRTRVQKQARKLKVDANSAFFRDAVHRFWMPRLMEKMGPLPDQSINSPLPCQLPTMPPVEPTPPTGARCGAAPSDDAGVIRCDLLQLEECSPRFSVDAMAPGSSHLPAPAPPVHHQYPPPLNVIGKYTAHDPFPVNGDLTCLAYGLDGLDLHLEGMSPPLPPGAAVGSSSASDCSMMLEVDDCIGGSSNNNSNMAGSLWSIWMNCGN